MINRVENSPPGRGALFSKSFNIPFLIQIFEPARNYQYGIQRKPKSTPTVLLKYGNSLWPYETNQRRKSAKIFSLVYAMNERTGTEALLLLLASSGLV